VSDVPPPEDPQPEASVAQPAEASRAPQSPVSEPEVLAKTASGAEVLPAVVSAEDSNSAAPGEALEEAVGLALRVLQGITLVLLLMFLGSGVFTVESNEVAFVQRMGILDDEALGPGLHWRWQVLDEVVRVEKTARTVPVSSFDLMQSKGALKGEETRKGGLDPERDGALLSGDSALVHVSLALSYAPRAPFLRSENRFRPAQGPDQPSDRERALRVLAERAAVHTAAGRKVEGLLSDEKREFLAAVQRRTQDALDTLEAGLEVKGLDFENDFRSPPQVREAFALVTQATQGVDKLRSEAKSRATQIESRGLVESDKIRGDARSQAAGISAESEALVQEFDALLEDYRRDPRAVRQRILTEALAESLAEVGESFLVGEGELRIKLQRDTRNKRAALKARAKERMGIR
jgi:modulator of FtsH protease HflK